MKGTSKSVQYNERIQFLYRMYRKSWYAPKKGDSYVKVNGKCGMTIFDTRLFSQKIDDKVPSNMRALER